MTRPALPSLLAASLACLLAEGRASAQGLDGERFVPAAGAAGGLQVERPVVPTHLGYGLGLFLNFADDPVVVRDRATGELAGKLVDHALSADLLGSLGLFDWFELAVGLPVRLVYRGDAATVDGAALAAAAGVGDLRLVPKMSFGWSGNASGGHVLGVALPLTLPTGQARALRGAGGVTVEPRFLALLYGARWLLDASLGFRFRGRDIPSAPGHELTFGLAATYTPQIAEDPLDLQLEAVGGWLPQGPGRALSALPLEVLGALVWKPHPRWRVYAGGGVGVTNGPGVPDARALAGVRYAVAVPGRGGVRDSDSDGVPDDQDRCPDQPEDMDGFQDGDGCPEPDNDHDGIADDDDECPDDAEEPGGDKDGCPDRPTVIVRKGKMVIYGKVLFPVGSAHMQPKSEVLIDQMAQALKDHPSIRRLEIEGHTDSTGMADFNKKLSQERADTVKEALIKRGIDGKRLVARGYGEERPVAPDLTRAGRAKNRRVEFTILEWQR
jgi:outer membrane protein OmpA-like peptidoglycan-associated protein